MSEIWMWSIFGENCLDLKLLENNQIFGEVINWSRHVFFLSKTFYKSTNQFSVLCVTALLIGHQKNLWFYATIKSANDVQY